MRLFVALDLDDEIRNRIALFVSTVRASSPNLRWVGTESLHVTLKFIGEKADDEVKRIEQTLQAIAAAPFDITFCGCGFFPNAHAPRVFWAGIEEDNSQLNSLALSVDNALATIGIPTENHAYRPHLTLARLKGSSGSPRKTKIGRSQPQLRASSAWACTHSITRFWYHDRASIFSVSKLAFVERFKIYEARNIPSALDNMLQTWLLPAITISLPSYLLGSIPFGYLLVRIFRGEDVRRSGSGNIGATNVSRKSPALGVATLLLDAVKGTAAVLLCDKIMRSASYPAYHPTTSDLALAALFAVIGHMFPIWLNFRGGKGVATGLGSFIVVIPKAVLIAVALFVIVVAISRFVSLGSMVAVAALPFLAWIVNRPSVSAQTLILTSVACLLIVLRHHQNIRRLLAGTESRLGARRT